MKHYLNISGDFSFYLLLAFLFLVNLSIAGCYLVFTLLLIQFIIFAVLSISIKNRGKTDQSQSLPSWPVMPKFYKYFLWFLLFSFISTLFSIDRINSLKDDKEFFIFLLIPIFLLILNSRKRLEYSLLTVLASALVSSLTGIFITLKEGISLDHRLRGLTSHWMTYSGLLMMVFIFFFVYLFYREKRNRKIIIAASLIIILASILLSLTRSMWIGIFAALGIFIVYYKPKILYLAVPAVIILILVMPPSVKSRIVSIFDPEDATNKDRLYMVTTAINIFKAHPLTGVGPDNVKSVYAQYKPAEAEQSNPHLHNNFLQVLAERGIFALVCLIAAFVSIFIQLIKKMRTPLHTSPGETNGLMRNGQEDEKILSTAVLFMFIGFFVAGMFEYNFGDSEIKFLLFYFLSLPFISYSKEEAPRRGVPIGE